MKLNTTYVVAYGWCVGLLGVLVSELYGCPTQILISPIVGCLSGPVLYIREHVEWNRADAREGVPSRL